MEKIRVFPFHFSVFCVIVASPMCVLSTSCSPKWMVHIPLYHEGSLVSSSEQRRGEDVHIPFQATLHQRSFVSISEEKKGGLESESLIKMIEVIGKSGLREHWKEAGRPIEGCRLKLTTYRICNFLEWSDIRVQIQGKCQHRFIHVGAWEKWCRKPDATQEYCILFRAYRNGGPLASPDIEVFSQSPTF